MEEQLVISMDVYNSFTEQMNKCVDTIKSFKEEIEEVTEAIKDGLPKSGSAKNKSKVSKIIDNTKEVTDDIKPASDTPLKFYNQCIEEAAKAEKANVEFARSCVNISKSLNDPKKAMDDLKNAGLNLSKNQRDQIENFVNQGKQAEAQKIIMEQLSKQTGGQTTAPKETYDEKSKKLKESVAHVKASIGEPWFEKSKDVTDSLINITNKFDKMPAPLKTVVQYATFAGGVFGKLASGASTVVDEIDKVKTAHEGFKKIRDIVPKDPKLREKTAKKNKRKNNTNSAVNTVKNIKKKKKAAENMRKDTSKAKFKPLTMTKKLFPNIFGKNGAKNVVDGVKKQQKQKKSLSIFKSFKGKSTKLNFDGMKKVFSIFPKVFKAKGAVRTAAIVASILAVIIIIVGLIKLSQKVKAKKASKNSAKAIGPRKQIAINNKPAPNTPNSMTITIPKIADTITIREEADIDKITNSLVAKLKQVNFNQINFNMA